MEHKVGDFESRTAIDDARKWLRDRGYTRAEIYQSGLQYGAAEVLAAYADYRAGLSRETPPLEKLVAAVQEFLKHDGGPGSEDYDASKHYHARRAMQSAFGLRCPRCGETLPHLYDENCTDYRAHVEPEAQPEFAGEFNRKAVVAEFGQQMRETFPEAFSSGAVARQEEKCCPNCCSDRKDLVGTRSKDEHPVGNWVLSKSGFISLCSDPWHSTPARETEATPKEKP